MDYEDSDLLMELIVFSELYHPHNNSGFFYFDTSIWDARGYEFTSSNYNDPYTNNYPEGVVFNVLLMTGDIDTRTPISWLKNYQNYATTHKNNIPNSNFIFFNSSAHGLISPLSNPTIGTHPCSVQIMGDWLSGEIKNVSQHPCIQLIRKYPTSPSDANNYIHKQLGLTFDAYDGGVLPPLITGLIVASIVAVIIVIVVAIICVLSKIKKGQYEKLINQY